MSLQDVVAVGMLPVYTITRLLDRLHPRLVQQEEVT